MIYYHCAIWMFKIIFSQVKTGTSICTQSLVCTLGLTRCESTVRNMYLAS